MPSGPAPRSVRGALRKLPQHRRLAGGSPVRRIRPRRPSSRWRASTPPWPVRSAIRTRTSRLRSRMRSAWIPTRINTGVRFKAAPITASAARATPRMASGPPRSRKRGMRPRHFRSPPNTPEWRARSATRPLGSTPTIIPPSSVRGLSSRPTWGAVRGAPHAGRCEDCHTVDGFQPSTFSLARHQSSAFPLKGAHAAMACEDCHRKAAARDGAAGPITSPIVPAKGATRTRTRVNSRRLCARASRKGGVSAKVATA